MKNQLLFTVALLWCASWSLSVSAATEAEEPLMTDVRMPLALLVACLDQELTSLATTLELAAESPQAKSAAWDQIKPVLQFLRAKRPVGAYWFALPDGTYFTIDQDRMDKKLDDRPYFPEVMKGKVSIGELVVGRSTKHNVTVVAVPVKAQDKVVGALGISVELGQVNDRIKAILNLPPDMLFYAIDRNGLVALHSEDRIFLEALTLGGSVEDALRTMVKSEKGRASYEFNNTYRDLAYQASALTGWRFALGTLKPITPVGAVR